MNKVFASALTTGIVLAALAGCQRDDTVHTGPAEKLGQKIDQATVKATEGINRLAEKAGQGMEKAGENMQNAAKDAQAKNGEK